MVKSFGPCSWVWLGICAPQGHVAWFSNFTGKVLIHSYKLAVAGCMMRLLSDACHVVRAPRGLWFLSDYIAP